MRYVSPAWLFNGRLPDKADPKVIRLRRTQLLADLELKGVSIDYRGETLTKNDIIALFDELQAENAFQWHIAIAKDNTLHTFLQDIHFDDYAVDNHCVRFLNNPIYENEEFIKWISPYFYDSFMFYMEVNCLRAANAHALVALLANPLLMTHTDQEKAWQATAKLIQRPIDQIQRHGATATNEAELAKTSRWMEEPFLQLVHLLPPGYFGPIRDQYALTIFKACENVCKKSPKYPTLTDRWMQNAIRLAYSPKIAKQLTTRRKKLFHPKTQLQRLSRVPPHVWLIIIIGLILCYWLGRRSH